MPQFANMLYDCLQERERHGLSDWAYYQMLKAFTDQVYGVKTNEATLVLAYLFSYSGYKVRLARYKEDDKNLKMVVSCRYTIYYKYATYDDGDSFYFLDENAKKSEVALVCQAQFSREGLLSLQLPAVQQIDALKAPERTITSELNKDFSFTICSNENYISFIKNYPDGQVPSQYMTRYAIRANTPMERSIVEQLYPKIREKLSGLSKKDAVLQLLWWVTFGLKYQFDIDAYGVSDRVNFAEESLYYNACDCEDRAILLSRLVRDLVGLDVILLYYEDGIDREGRQFAKGTHVGGHMAMAVCFPDDEGVVGDRFEYDGRYFYVCDPTIIIPGENNIGVTMCFYEGVQPSIILLKR